MLADQSFDILASEIRFLPALRKAFFTQTVLLRAMPSLATALLALIAFLLGHSVTQSTSSSAASIDELTTVVIVVPLATFVVT